jgi:hypothetical protein
VCLTATGVSVGAITTFTLPFLGHGAEAVTLA